MLGKAGLAESWKSRGDINSPSSKRLDLDPPASDAFPQFTPSLLYSSGLSSHFITSQLKLPSSFFYRKAMSDSPRQRSHVAALAALPITPPTLSQTVTIRSSRRKPKKPVPLLYKATENSLLVKYPELRVQTSQTSLSKAYSAPNRAHALRESNKENNTMSSPSMAKSNNVWTERSNTASSQIPGAYPTSSEESISSRAVSITSESETVTSESLAHTAIVTPAGLAMAPSPLDKELPVRPVLRNADSFEKRGIYGMADYFQLYFVVILC
jgi:hypothetical protein